MAKSPHPDPNEIPPGTRVVAEDAELGDADVTTPVVDGAVPHPETGEPALQVKKPGSFQKELIVPRDRVERFDGDRVSIDLDAREVEQLSPFGTSVIPPRERSARPPLGAIVPDMPGAADQGQNRPEDAREETEEERRRQQAEVERVPVTRRAVLRALGPGLIAGAADNDPTTVGTLAVIGSPQTAYALSWLLLLVLPMMAAIQSVAGAVATATGRDLQVLIKERFGRGWSWLALSLLLGVTVFTLAADLEGGAAALGLFTHLPWRIFTLPLAGAVAAALFFGSYAWIRRGLSLVMFVFLLYVPAAFLARPHWASVLAETFIPHLSFAKDYVAGALALLGTTLTSYVYFWETNEEVEEVGKRPRRLAQLDATAGMVVATAVFWFILIATGATLGSQHQTVQTAQEAAALKPVAGPAAY